MGRKINFSSDLEFIKPVMGSNGQEVSVINRSELLENINKLSDLWWDM